MIGADILASRGIGTFRISSFTIQCMCDVGRGIFWQLHRRHWWLEHSLPFRANWRRSNRDDHQSYRRSQNTIDQRSSVTAFCANLCMGPRRRDVAPETQFFNDGSTPTLTLEILSLKLTTGTCSLRCILSFSRYVTRHVLTYVCHWVSLDDSGKDSSNVRECPLIQISKSFLNADEFEWR